MWQELRTHWIAYAVLVIGLFFFTYAYLYFWPNEWFVRYVSLALGCFYACWGIVTHTKTKRITPRVVWEYVLVAGIAVLLLWLVTI